MDYKEYDKLTRVQIKRSYSPLYWYKDYIGQAIDVHGSRGTIYFVGPTPYNLNNFPELNLEKMKAPLGIMMKDTIITQETSYTNQNFTHFLKED